VKHALWRGAPDAPISVHDFDLFDAEKMAVVGGKSSKRRRAWATAWWWAAARNASCTAGRRSFTCFCSRPSRSARSAWRNGGQRARNLEAVIREYDRLRAAGVRQYFDQEWCNPNLYDLMINTKRGYESATETILCAAG